ncbi:MAG: chemotaxis protein CheD [Gemmatimonadaceae bacterium]|nr:chemotaxis protein CheD [Gemmatimonadaceae bacterium]NUP56000.1 chemotaxis protein CheD [Gemmatimonadaceae bacterium]NUP72583.1 chemotaxis protein CheD [Gemmatimonadaceae bacterium]NUR32700.1 chemotaxis protein CheD [Gemmatimonadaceae bacterium]NUS34694.1 chemotaxis protein CheD [Gemmatimonadaceae bacterium]
MSRAATEIRVKVADYAVARGPQVIATIGLGSCVAIALYDRDTQIGALAHILLPNQAMSRETGNPAKFPDTIVPLMLEQMREMGTRHARVQAKIVGGASMFGQLVSATGINVGERNVAATREALAASGVPIIAEDTGLDYGRSVYFHLADGRLEVRSLKKGDRVI